LAFLLADAGWTRTYFMAIGAEAFLLMAALLVASAVIVRLRRTSNEGARNAG
jgi:DMSO/TMAO reductase YedYZ heme-binding membrane subunit